MSIATEPRDEAPSAALADEIHSLEAQEAELERRTRSLELSGPLALLFAFFALALSIGAFIVALGRDSEHLTSAPTMMGGSTSGVPGMMAASGHHGSFTSSQIAAAAKGTVYVQLGDFWAAPAVSAVRAGKVTFIARNVGKVQHELMIERMPMTFDAPMQPNEEAAQGMIDDMEAGHSGRLTMNLRPGTYMLFCNIPGHYAAGQHIRFTATAS